MARDDVRAIQAQCDLITSLSAELPLGQNVKAKVGDRETDVSPNGVQPDYERLRNVQTAHGRFISEEDIDSWAKVCVIGDKIGRELFPDTDPLGRSLQVNGVSLTVV